MARLYCVARSVLFSFLNGKVEEEVADKFENEVEVELELRSVNWNGQIRIWGCLRSNILKLHSARAFLYHILNLRLSA